MCSVFDVLFACKKKSIQKSNRNPLLLLLIVASFLIFSSPTHAASSSDYMNFVAPDKATCEKSLASNGCPGTCSFGGGCGMTCGVPNSSCASANPNGWGSCVLKTSCMSNPSNLSVSCLYGKLTANWSSVTGATYYPVRLSKAGDNNNLIIQEDPYTSTSYTLSGNTGTGSPLAVGSYDFWVHALDATNNLWSSGVAVKNIQCTAPPAPAELSASCSNGVITARWNSVSGIDNYAVRVDYKQDVSGNSTNNKNGCTETSGWYCGTPDILSDAYNNNSFTQGGFPDGTYDFWVQTYVSTLPHPTNWSPITKIGNIVCATDNGCAANTCSTTTCNNGSKTVQGTKVCPDNSCAANTCTSTTCWNNLNWIPGTKNCPVDNGCAANTCITATCNNSLAWVSGTKTCAVDNGCAANTCTNTTCFNGIAAVQGTKICEVSVNGACGSSNATTLDNAPAANLCTAGTTSTVSGSGPWTWTCAGSGGGSTATCSASKKVTATDNGCAANTCANVTCFNGIANVQGTKVCPVAMNGVCGSVNASTIDTIPAVNLCATGTASAVSGIGPWTWTCAGSNGGASVSCRALKTATDNGCAKDTCTKTACWNGSTWTDGTKVCADNGCAANTCSGLPCNNGTTWVTGSKNCPDNGCAAKTCAGIPCNNNLGWIVGTKICTDNGCAANTCTTATCDNGIETVAGTKVCPIACTQYAAPICNPGESVATTTFSADGCPTVPKCQPTKDTCPAYASIVPICKAGETIVPGGTDANGCGLPPKCQGNCPVLNAAAPICKEGETLTLSENDANGCPQPPVCKKTTCPIYPQIDCQQGYVPVAGQKDANDCVGRTTCQPANKDCATTNNVVVCGAGEIKVTGQGVDSNGCPFLSKCIACGKEGASLRNESISPTSNPSTAPTVCCEGLTPVFPTRANDLSLTGAAAVCKKITDNCAKEGESLAGTGLPNPSTPSTAPKVCCSGLKPVYPVTNNGAPIQDAPAVCKKTECAVTANYVMCVAGETKVSGGIAPDGCPLPDKCQKIDNGCAANTCSTTTCNNGTETVKGTKACADNGCAANTCSNFSCWNNLTWVPGTKNCVNNNCTTNICSNTICWNNLNWLVGIKPCNNNNNCSASTTCQTSDRGLPTACNGTPGTKQSVFTDHYITKPLKCSVATCGKTIPTQTVLCTRVDSNNCNNPTACLVAPPTPPTQQCPACFKIKDHGTKETLPTTN